MHQANIPFRRVTLPTPGGLFLHSMPGRFEPFADVLASLRAQGIQRVVCLTPLDEIREKAPDYARAIAHGLPLQLDFCPIQNFGVPDERRAFVLLAQQIAEVLRGGQHVLVHCAAGIGRTGTFASTVAIALGLPFGQAIETVRAAGSSPDTAAQMALIAALKA